MEVGNLDIGHAQERIGQLEEVQFTSQLIASLSKRVATYANAKGCQQTLGSGPSRLGCEALLTEPVVIVFQMW